MTTNFQPKSVNVLSFDGGGTRGLMEIKILQHIMLALSALRQNPQEILEVLQPDQMLTKSSTRINLRKIIESNANVIHPTEVFNFIVGKHSMEMAGK